MVLVFQTKQELLHIRVLPTVYILSNIGGITYIFSTLRILAFTLKKCDNQKKKMEFRIHCKLFSKSDL